MRIELIPAGGETRAAVGALAVGLVWAAETTSRSRIRPVTPVPAICPRSRPKSRAARRARGLATWEPVVTPVGTGAGWVCGAAVATRATAGGAAWAGVAAEFEAAEFEGAGERPPVGGSSPGWTNQARTCPTLTVSPGRGPWGGIRRMPASTASMSCADFSPSSTNRGSPRATVAPLGLSHSPKVPSSIDHPRRGTTISIAMSERR